MGHFECCTCAEENFLSMTMKVRDTNSSPESNKVFSNRVFSNIPHSIVNNNNSLLLESIDSVRIQCSDVLFEALRVVEASRWSTGTPFRKTGIVVYVWIMLREERKFEMWRKRVWDVWDVTYTREATLARRVHHLDFKRVISHHRILSSTGIGMLTTAIIHDWFVTEAKETAVCHIASALRF